MSALQSRSMLHLPPAFAALLAALLITFPGTAHAFSQLTVGLGSQSIVDKGSILDTGSFLVNGLDSFDVDVVSQAGPLVTLKLEKFQIPQTVDVTFQHFEFLLEKPGSPGVFQTKRDVLLTWDQSTGDITSETFRVQLVDAGAFGSGSSAYYDITLSTAGSPALTCGSNTFGAISGLALPAGANPPPGSPITMAGAACSLPTSAGVPENSFPTYAFAVQLNATIPEPGTMLLLSGGLLGLGWLGRRRTHAS